MQFRRTMEFLLYTKRMESAKEIWNRQFRVMQGIEGPGVNVEHWGYEPWVGLAVDGVSRGEGSTHETQYWRCKLEGIRLLVGLLHSSERKTLAFVSPFCIWRCGCAFLRVCITYKEGIMPLWSSQPWSSTYHGLHNCGGDLELTVLAILHWFIGDISHKCNPDVERLELSAHWQRMNQTMMESGH
jgi:hypothetical protein